MRLRVVPMKLRKLTEGEKRIILHGGTEPPFSGKYDRHFENGAYACRRCGALLFRSSDKFRSGCGWPSFDDSVPGAVRRLQDADGARTEIRCARCDAHLGHVFEGERLTGKNIRHCVNSVSLEFVPPGGGRISRIAFGAGCFWCTEAVFSGFRGVLSAAPGYAGGRTKNPTYEQVCSGNTGHAEVVLVEYDRNAASLEDLLGLFFRMHDPTSRDRQGNDVGTQYRSIILYTKAGDDKAIWRFMKGVRVAHAKPVVTEVRKLSCFYPADEIHRGFFHRNPGDPYCTAVIAPKLERMRQPGSGP